MPSDTAITELLYAILSQKCLKDIDWNKVASHPLLSQKITNGHAARMRYSRFKKQIDGDSVPKKPRKPYTPRKDRVLKNTSAKSTSKSANKSQSSFKSEKDREIKGEEAEGRVRVKTEYRDGDEGEEGESQNTEPNMNDGVYVKEERDGMGYGMRRTHLDSKVMLATPGPSTPCTSNRAYSREQSVTPSPNGSFGQIGEMDEMLTSFGMESGMGGMYSPLMQNGEMSGNAYGMNMHAGLGDPFENMWGGHGERNSHDAAIAKQIRTERREEDHGIAVKEEPRWEESYRPL